MAPPMPNPRRRAAAALQPGAAEGCSPKGVATVITSEALDKSSAMNPAKTTAWRGMEPQARDIICVVLRARLRQRV